MATENGCTFIDKLADYPDPRTNDRPVPTLKILAQRDGVRIVRLTFRDGDVLADHAAPVPILVLGQKKRSHSREHRRETPPAATTGGDSMWALWGSNPRPADYK